MVRPPQEVRRDATREIGTLLLRGWTMLAEYCPGCLVPLMRDPATRHEHCVQCGTIYTNGGQHVVSPANQATPTPPPAENGPVTENGHSTTSLDQPTTPSQQQQPVPQPAAGASDVDDAAELLSQRLVQGWALLNDHCPVCSTPLMRDPQRQRQCVVCNAPVYTEQEAAARQVAAAPASAQAPTPGATGGEGAGARTAAAGAAGAGAAERAAAPGRQAQPQGLPSHVHEPPQASSAPSAALTPAAPITEAGRVLAGVSSVILFKLTETANLLNTADPSNSEQCHAYVSLLRAYVAAYREIAEGG